MPVDEFEFRRLVLLVQLLQQRLSDVWPPRPKPQAVGGGTGSLEYVVFSGHVGSPGDATTLSTFRYTFTDASGTTRTNKAPVHQRSYGAKLVGVIGIWDNVALELVWTDEVDDKVVGCA